MRGKYEKPLELLNAPANGKQKIVLEFSRDEDAIKEEYHFRAEQNRVRCLALGSCRLADIKLEKNGAFEFVAKVSPPFVTDNIILGSGSLLRVRRSQGHPERWPGASGQVHFQASAG